MKKIVLEGNAKKIAKLKKELALKLKRSNITCKDYVEAEPKKIAKKVIEKPEKKEPVKRNYKRKK